MGRKALTREESITVSDIASRIHECEVIFTDQTAFFQQDVKGYKAAYSRVFAGQSHQGPMDSDREGYAEWKSAMEAYFLIEPRNLDE